MIRIFVMPAPGRKVRTEDGRRHIKEAGEAVNRTRYIRRRLDAGDLLEAEQPDPEPSPEAALARALRELEKGNPDHWNQRGQPDLNHLAEVLHRQVTRKEVDLAMKQMEP